MGGAVCGVGGKMPKGKLFEDGLSKFRFSPANLHLEEKNSYATIVDPPQNAQKAHV